MEIVIDMNSAVPVYEQIVHQVKQGVLKGDLTAGDNLPAIRKIAYDLGLNQNTVAKAYKLLEQQHVTLNRGRRGTCIHAAACENISKINTQNAAIELDALVRSFSQQGMSEAAIFSVLQNQMATMSREG